MEFVFRAVGEVGATLNAALVVMGDKLGLYQALAEAGPLTPDELAGRTGLSEGAISYLRSGRRQPSFKSIRALAGKAAFREAISGATNRLV